MMLKRGSQLVSAWVKSPCSYVVEALARKGSFNAVTLDLQHGMTDLAAAATNLRIIAASGVAPVVRLTSQDPGHIGRCLDFGASAVICPMINTVHKSTVCLARSRYSKRVFTRSEKIIYTFHPFLVVRACVRACVRTCVYVCMCVCVQLFAGSFRSHIFPCITAAYIRPSIPSFPLSPPTDIYCTIISPFLMAGGAS